MVRIVDSITVPAPVDQVYQFMDASIRLIELTPGMQKSGDLGGGAAKGKESKVEYTYEVTGMPIRGVVEISESEQNRKVVYSLSGPTPGTFTWTFTPQEGATKVELEAEYGSQMPMPDSMLAFFTKAYNENNIKVMLERLRDQFKV